MFAVANPRVRKLKLLVLWLAITTSLGTAAAQHGGTLTGTVLDASGAVVPGARLSLINTAQQTRFQAQSNGQGVYTFPSLPVGVYVISASADGFSPQRRSGVTVDTDAVLRMDFKLAVGSQSDAITVSSAAEAVQVESSATHLGEVVSAAAMTSLPLNGRSFTDLLSIQPGVAPVTTLLPSSVIMAGVTGSINPSGDQNPGTLSISGQRESSNGFLVNGVDVQEHMNGGTSILPNLDSIEEFRVLTNNFDPEYGNYNGGIVSVVSKAGSNQMHGSAFEFFRNTALDARGYFDPTRSAFNQNQFGSTFGTPILHDKLFAFVDYQGTRTTQGISTGNISVPTNAERAGTFADLSGTVSGPYFASLLSAKLGYRVSSGEAYTDVFPGGVIPQSAWSAPAKHLLPYTPVSNVRDGIFSTSAESQTVRDDKGSVRLDGNSRLGQVSAYYFVDDYRLDNPYPGVVAGANIPGFDALFIGRAQLFSLGATKVIGAALANDLRAGLVRNSNIVGQPKGGLGVPLASQGFDTGGIFVQAPQFEGIENLTFPTFVMGVPITNETQVNNTLFLADGLSWAHGAHTFKFGGQIHFDQVNEHPNATFNGTFNINGTETGNPYADFLLGVASNYTQSSGPPFYLRNRYAGLYAQDSWRARSNLTVNAGLRWDVIMPWWEKYNQLQTYVPGQQSVLYPGAPKGFVVAGDPGIPRTVAPTDYRSFAPRIGFAYTPSFGGGLLSRIFGASQKSSIRASYGIFYTAFQGLATGIMYAVPPFGYNYLSPAPPLLASPFLTAATGENNGQRFPFPFPPHNVSRASPDNAVDWADLTPISADPFFDHRNRPAYIDDYMVSLQRQFSQNLLFTASYVGNQGHRILALVSANPGDPALCLSLPGCAPFGEDATYRNARGRTIQGTRTGQGSMYGENTADRSIANSNYNALETMLRFQHIHSDVLLSYTYAKSIDQGSNLGEQLNPINPRQSRAISAWDMRHDFVASYTLALPVSSMLHKASRATEGWSLAGTTRFASGFPVTLYDNSDKSLLGTLGNGANNYLLDTPQYLPGPLQVNRNPRKSLVAFNTSIFPEERLGELGNAKRRIFHGPGIDNSDATLRKKTALGDSRSLELRLEAFNVFNHAQFYGPAAVNGQRQSPQFGNIQSAAAPRLMQLAAKFNF